jgi:CBS domain containing-hemolysin-like protein
MNLIIQAAIIITITGFFGMLEAALFTVPISRARVLASQKKSGAEALLTLKRSMARPIFLLVVFVNISTVLGSIILGKNAGETAGVSVGLVSALMTIGIIIFGELLPKSFGDKHAETIARFFAPFLIFITKLFTPIVWLYEKGIIFLLGSHTTPVSEDDLRVLSETSHTEGGIEADEKEIILNTFRMNDTHARDIMTPRVNIEALPEQITLQEALVIIGDKPFSRMPVYSKNIDDIVGVVTSKDILRALAHGEHANHVSQYIRPHTTVSETMRADHLLGMFQKQKMHCAIVVDDFGGTAGFITLEDVLEVLVGEIMDETDEIEDLRKPQYHSKNPA